VDAVPDKLIPNLTTLRSDVDVITLNKMGNTLDRYLDDKTIVVFCEQYIAAPAKNKKRFVEKTLIRQCFQCNFILYSDKRFGKCLYTKSVKRFEGYIVLDVLCHFILTNSFKCSKKELTLNH